MSDVSPPRRAGWIRIGLFFVLGAVAAWLEHYILAALFALVGAGVWWIDRSMARRPPEG